MSHFTVAVRVPASVEIGSVEDEVAKMLIPYKESGCGDDDPPELKKYMEFEDEEDEHVEQYATDTTPCFVDPTSQICFTTSDTWAAREPAFWEHIENVTGKRLTEDHRENTFFSCSC